MNIDLFREEFARNFAERGELGAAVSVWMEGESRLELAAGWQEREADRPWTSETTALLFSATKGPSVATVHLVCERQGVNLESPVARVWPEFAAAGKEGITLAELLSHQAGLPGLRTPVPVEDYEAVVAGLAAEEPWWPPGQEHGYHPRTYGYLLDEVVRRLSGQRLAEVWRTEFAEPLALDLFIGLPPGAPSPATVYPARQAPPKGDPFYTAFLTSGSPTARAFTSPRGLNGPAALSTPEAQAGEYPAFGGIGSARALAKFYSVLACDGVLDGRRYFSPATTRRLGTLRVQGPDRILLGETAFSLGMMKDPLDASGRKLREVFGPSHAAFGQPGAGGSHAFADPEQRVAFAYVMNQMEPGVLPGEKSLRLVHALYA